MGVAACGAGGGVTEAGGGGGAGDVFGVVGVDCLGAGACGFGDCASGLGWAGGFGAGSGAGPCANAGAARPALPQHRTKRTAACRSNDRPGVTKNLQNRYVGPCPSAYARACQWG